MVTTNSTSSIASGVRELSKETLKKKRNTFLGAATLSTSSSIQSVLARRRSAQEMLTQPPGHELASAAMPARVSGEVGFILHAYNWSETSQLLDVLTERYGRVFLVAKGSKRASCIWRGLLTPFCPLKLTWSGKKEAKILIKADWLGTMTPLTGESLLSGFYVNELVLRLTQREDRHAGLFESYVRVIHVLAQSERTSIQAALRHFEVMLLKFAGWAVVPQSCENALVYVVRDGVVTGLADPAARLPHERTYRPEVLHAIVNQSYQDAALSREIRELLKELIQFYMGGREVNTRRILTDLKRL